MKNSENLSEIVEYRANLINSCCHVYSIRTYKNHTSEYIKESFAFALPPNSKIKDFMVIDDKEKLYRAEPVSHKGALKIPDDINNTEMTLYIDSLPPKKKLMVVVNIYVNLEPSKSGKDLTLLLPGLKLGARIHLDIDTGEDFVKFSSDTNLIKIEKMNSMYAVDAISSGDFRLTMSYSKPQKYVEHEVITTETTKDEILYIPLPRKDSDEKDFVYLIPRNKKPL